MIGIKEAALLGLKEEHRKLTEIIEALERELASEETPAGKPRKTRRRFSAQTRRRMSQAQQRRWTQKKPAPRPAQKVMRAG